MRSMREWIVGSLVGLAATSSSATCVPGQAIFDRNVAAPWCPYAPGGACPTGWHSSGEAWGMVAPPGCDRALIKMWGTGGSGHVVGVDLYGGPGGGGGYADAEFSVVPGATSLAGRFDQPGVSLAGETTTLEACFQTCPPPYSESLRGDNHRRTNVWSAAGGGGNGSAGAAPTCLIDGRFHTCRIDGGAGGAGGGSGTPATLRSGCPCALASLFQTPGQGGSALAPGAGGSGSASGDCPGGHPEGIGGGDPGTSTSLCNRGGQGWWGGGAGGFAQAGVGAGSGGGGSGPIAAGPGYRFGRADGSGRAPARESDPDRTALAPGRTPVDPGRGAFPARSEPVGPGRVVVYWFDGADPADEEVCQNSFLPSDFWVTAPCRVADTRILLGAAPIAHGQRRRVQLRGVCGVPAGAEAVSIQITAIPRFGGGHLSFSPGCRPAGPLVASSVVNFQPGAARSNGVIVPVDPDDGHIVVDAGVTEDGWLDFTIDVTGYFAP